MSETIDGVSASLIDFAIPVVLIPATELGKSGYESKPGLDCYATLLAKIERLRRKAAARMGLPDAGHSVVPKVALLAPPREGGSIASRFYVPWNCHVAHSTTGALCIAAAAHIPGTVAALLGSPDSHEAPDVVIEHPSGRLAFRLQEQSATDDGGVRVGGASVVLTARPLFDGYAFASRPHS